MWRQQWELQILEQASVQRLAAWSVGRGWICTLTKVRLHVGTDNFKIIGHFSDQLPIPCLLGRRGFFDKYIVTFDPTETNPGFELTRVHRT
jgi:hypothetical protein